MGNSKRMLVTSCKGGVGKSTVSANLAWALVRRGRTVLLVDMDLGNRSLDIMLGLEDSTLFDICDVAACRCDAGRAILKQENRPGLFFVAAPYLYDDSLTAESLDAALSALEDACRPDFTILDTSGGADCSVRLSAAVAQRALVVTTPAPAAVRAAEKSGDILAAAGITKLGLIISGSETNARDADEHYGVNEMIDLCAVPIFGIVPRDANLAMLGERALLCGESRRIKSNAGAAFDNIAARICGENIPLLYGVRGIKNRKKLLQAGRR